MNIFGWIGWLLVALASSVTLAFGVIRTSLNSHRTTPPSAAPVSMPLGERSVTNDSGLVGNQAPRARSVDMMSFVKRILPEKEKGKPYTQQLHEYVRGEIEHHTHGLHMAGELRESGARFAAEDGLTREYLRHARKAVDLHKITGIDRAGVTRLLDPSAHLDEWHHLRRKALLKGGTVPPQDAQISRFARLWAKMTRRLYKGSCQALYQHHRTGLRHAQELESMAGTYLAEGLNDQALEVLRSEAERHFQLSFRPGEKIETF